MLHCDLPPREYDRLIKCLYMLEYVDNQTLRQFVQQALNRGEAYHQLLRAIASVNGNQFRGQGGSILCFLFKQYVSDLKI